MIKEFAIAEVPTGTLNAAVKNIMSQMGISNANEAVRLINSGEWIVVQNARQWHEQDGVIYFSVTSNGMTGSEWIEHLEKKGFRVGDYAKSVLRSSDFKPTRGITTEIALLKGMLFDDDDRITNKICAEGDRRGLKHGKDINPEIACLIREKFSDKEIEAMGLLWIVAMHEPINDSDGSPGLLSASRFGDGRWLAADYDDPGGGWTRGGGFAFVVPQVSSD